MRLRYFPPGPIQNLSLRNREKIGMERTIECVRQKCPTILNKNLNHQGSRAPWVNIFSFPLGFSLGHIQDSLDCPTIFFFLVNEVFIHSYFFLKEHNSKFLPILFSIVSFFFLNQTKEFFNFFLNYGNVCFSNELFKINHKLT